jgi:hypothetical protein
MNIWACLMDGRVDGEGGSVDGFVAFYDFTRLVYKDKVGDPDQGEVG